MENLEELFQMMKPKNMFDLSPRKGFYTIKSVTKRDWFNQSVLIAVADWRPHSLTSEEYLEVEVHLGVFTWHTSIGPKELIKIDNVINKILEVEDAYLQHDESGEKLYFHTKWNLYAAKKVTIEDDLNEGISVENEMVIIDQFLSNYKNLEHHLYEDSY